MNTTNRTFTFVAVAAIAALAALGARYANRPVDVDGFSDVGQEFFADFKDPLKASALSVVKFDAEAKEPLSFSVTQNDKGLWVIPSHHDYPAEAKERLARTAASLIGVSKLAMQSRSKDDWARYGVADPAEEGTAELAAKDGGKEGSRGTRVTLKDSSSNSLVDLIIGKPVEGREKHFYVRQPDKNPVFIAKLDADLSAKFSDWIEPDLLKLNQNDIVQLTVDKYSVDEAQGAILQGDTLKFSKDKTANKWSLEGLDPAAESLKELPVTDLTRNLDQLKIVGVRPKPEGLNADLTVSQDVAQNPLMRQILKADMQQRGFFIAPDQNQQVRLWGNEGEFVAGTSNGVRYTLYFGETARGTAKDIETGLNDPKPEEPKPDDAAAAVAGETKADGTDAAIPETPKPDETPESPESGPRRYLLVKVDYDETLLGPKPTEPVAPEKPAILNDAPAPAEPTPTEPAAPPQTEPTATEPPAAAPAPAETPAADLPMDEAPKESAPASDTPSDPAPEKPPEPGSCDEPPAAEPAAPAQDVPAADPVAEPVVQETTVPAADAPAPTEPAAPASDPGAASAQESAPVAPAADETAPAVSPVDPNAPVATPEPPAQPPVDPKAEAQKQYDQAMGEFEAAKAGHADAVKSWEERAKEGKKKVDELSLRFGAWYYVISADSFEKFQISRADVIGPKEEPKPAGGAGAVPGHGAFPGAGSLPPDFNLPGAGN